MKMLVSPLALALGVLAVAAPAAAETGSYGYLSVVEGSATLMQAGTTERSSAEINQPVLAGDRLWVPDRSRVEIVLADRNILRIDGGSELVLERLAASPDRDDRATVLRLLEGNLQLVVLQDSLGDELPRIETPNATIYPQNYGVYRVTADREGWSQVVVRRGTAEVVTDRGSARVKADEEAVIDGDDRNGASAEVRPATGFDSLERWARRLDDESSYASANLRYVDDNLRYQAAPLNRYGDWIYVDGSPYWRPRVAYDWRPYWRGRWIYTPVGLTWLSYEPWGWVPYHYGSWDYLPGYGWAWQPGYVWSPAWVYWYWGPSYVGWCPTGYYTRYYGPRFGFSFGFRFGVYGWAGGDWGHFNHWTFVPTTYFGYDGGYRHGYRDGYRDGFWDGRRDVHRYAVPIDTARNIRTALERGIITTDTRPLKPSTWRSTDEVARALRPGKGPNELPDVTPFIARKPDLPPTVARTVRAEGNPGALDGTPLRPDTLGHEVRRRVEIGGGEPAGSDRPGRQPRIGLGDRPAGDANDGRAAAGEKPNRSGRPSPEADGGTPRPSRRIVIDNVPSGRPGPSAGDAPAVRERPARPSPNDDGGAPRPSRRIVTDNGPSGRPDRSPGDAPAVRERPGRPSADTDGGAPRPEPRPDWNGRLQDRPSRPPADRDQGDNVRRPERPREDVYVRPGARSERPERYERPAPPARPEPRVTEPRYRTPEPSRPDPPRYDRGSESRPRDVRPSPPPRSRGDEGSRSQGRERRARPRNNGDGNQSR
ncbi:MAG TPA: DUF6600 domain-containing protein [Thermoanaerobaculia bacterium]